MKKQAILSLSMILYGFLNVSMWVIWAALGLYVAKKFFELWLVTCYQKEI